ncbi:hypothetical protein STSP2_00979 [Anaerohalosphaera lusitana]|uniref:Uncharacterized protein n=1 Tax=Anaerohalosphaera lusitana TaxID=1936003 RepID=A0A1U9NJA8_9BACT|nr:PEP-CTERM sorting domain-containing protein [Anaerohalosphaera lusitana]AQT67828.1 hypothetical protein STSP2_00979 [Anaerohalosphaera lusitana]
MGKLTLLSFLASLFIVSSTTQAVDKKLYSIADGENDPSRRYPNGSSYIMWTDYDATFSNYRRRAVIKFDTSSVSNYTLRGAVLNIWGSSGSGSNTTAVNIYHYSYDSWSDSSIPYASSLGTKLGSVSVTKVNDVSQARKYDISLSNMPYISPYDNNLSMALVANSGYGSYFVTRNGVNWNGTANKKPYLTFRTWGETATSNGSFDDGLDSWNINSGGGTAEMAANPFGDGNLAKLTTGSPVGITQIIDTPQDAFYINFDYAFLTDTGSLDVTLTDRDGGQLLVGQLEAGDSIAEQMSHASFYLQDDSWLYLDHVTLGLQFDGASGSQVLLDNIEFSDVPEPSSILLIGLGGLLMKRKSRQA